MYARIWNSFRAHFGLGKNDALPPSRMTEAIDFLVRFDLSPRKKPALENSGRLELHGTDKVRKMIVDDIDQVEKKLRQIESLIKWQLSPTSRDAGFTREKMDYFNMLLHMNQLAQGSIYTARQAICAAGLMQEKR